MTKTITKANGSVRGYITEAGDKKNVTSANGTTLGWYLKSQNKTFNRKGNMIGAGDQTGTLFQD